MNIYIWLPPVLAVDINTIERVSDPCVHMCVSKPARRTMAHTVMRSHALISLRVKPLHALAHCDARACGRVLSLL